MWGRYDILMLPPSFPYGGMENPCLVSRRFGGSGAVAVRGFLGTPHRHALTQLLLLRYRFSPLVTTPHMKLHPHAQTFVTPTLIAADRSLADVVAHEIAHSWTGNLVTNATWESFWLNEGFTMMVRDVLVVV